MTPGFQQMEKRMRKFALFGLAVLTLAGCSRGEPLPVRDWSQDVEALHTGILACARATPESDVVLTAWPLSQGLMMARLRLSGGQRQDCLVVLGNNARVKSLKPVLANDVRKGEGQPLLWMREDHPNCSGAHRVKIDGEFFGWIVNDCTIPKK